MKEKKSVVEKRIIDDRYLLLKEERGEEIFAAQNSIDRESSHAEKKQGVKQYQI